MQTRFQHDTTLAAGYTQTITLRWTERHAQLIGDSPTTRSLTFEFEASVRENNNQIPHPLLESFLVVTDSPERNAPVSLEVWLTVDHGPKRVHTHAVLSVVQDDYDSYLTLSSDTLIGEALLIARVLPGLGFPEVRFSDDDV